MRDHAHVMRSALLVGSLLTLSGLHLDRQRVPSGWRIVRLLPLSLCAFSIVGIAGYVLSVSGSAKDLLYSLTSSATIAHSMLVMAHLLRHRRQLHRLLRDVAALENSTSGCRRARDHAFIQRRSVVLVLVSAFALFCWVAGFFATQQLKHPNYLLDWTVPTALHSKPWYYVSLAIQLAFGIIPITMQIVFDVVLQGFIDALSLFQLRLVRYIDAAFSQTCAVGRSSPDQHHQSIEDTETVFASDAWMSPDQVKQRPHKDSSGNVGAEGHSSDLINFRGASAPTVITVRPAKVCPAPYPSPAELLEVTVSLDLLLRRVTEVYKSVRHLACEANAFCSLPILSLHACVTATLLLGSYVSNLMYCLEDNISTEIYGFATFTLMAVFRLMLVSASGSGLMQRGQQLHQTLTFAHWPEDMSGREKFLLQMLAEQTRTPIAFEGWGLLTVQKGTMLTLFSFVLTYFVIMVQMDVA